MFCNNQYDKKKYICIDNLMSNNHYCPVKVDK